MTSNCPRQYKIVKGEIVWEGQQKLFSLESKAIWGGGITKPKKLKNPTPNQKPKKTARAPAVYMFSHAEIASLGQLLEEDISCCAGPAAAPAQGRCSSHRHWGTKALHSIFASQAGLWKWSPLFLESLLYWSPHFHKASWPPSSPNGFHEYSFVCFRFHYSSRPTLSVLYEVISVPVQKDPAGALIKSCEHNIKVLSFAPLSASHILLPAFLFQLKMNRKEEEITACTSGTGNNMTCKNMGGDSCASRKSDFMEM